MKKELAELEAAMKEAQAASIANQESAPKRLKRLFPK